MTLYRSKTETVEAFCYLADLETMDFRYPYPDWLEGCVVVRGEFGLDLDTKFGKVTVRPGSGSSMLATAIYRYWIRKFFTQDMRH